MKSRLLHNVVNKTPLKAFLASNRFIVRSYFNTLYLRTDPYATVRRNQQAKIEQAFQVVDGFKANRALELGCGEGRWAKYAASLADHLLAIDISDLAINRARASNDLENVEFRQGDVMSLDLPAERYDFIFCSEMLYYLTLEQLDQAVQRIIELLRPGGKLLLVNARSLKDDEVGLELKEFGARTIHERFAAERGHLQLERDLLEPEYRISLFSRAAPASAR